MKKGFTLVELIAVIGVLALLMVLVVPTIAKSSSAAKQKTYQTKVEMITSAGVMYGQDKYRTIINQADDNKEEPGKFKCYTKEEVKGTKTQTIRHCVYKVSTLVDEQYIEPDGDVNGHRVEDPRSKGSYLDDCEVDIAINPNNKKVTAEFIEKTVAE